MANLEDTVQAVVEELMETSELFTALDVSNKVKVLMPNARHREVRDMVRAMFVTDIEPKGWGRAPITVTLDDGTTAEALLYHPLSDSWDLDNKYDAQRRNRTSLKPVAVAAAAIAAVQAAQATTTTIAATPAPVVPTPMPTARDLWKQLFTTQPSLFPKA